MRTTKIVIFCLKCKRHLKAHEWEKHEHGSFYWAIEHRDARPWLKRVLQWFRKEKHGQEKERR